MKGRYGQKTSNGFEEKKDDWKLLKTNINQRNRGDKCTLKEKQQCCLWHLRFCFWIFLYSFFLGIVFVYLNHIFCFFVFDLNMHCWTNAARLGTLALPILYNHLSPLFNEFFLVSAPVRTFSDKIETTDQVLDWYHIICIYQYRKAKHYLIRQNFRLIKICIRSNWKQALTYSTPVWTFFFSLVRRVPDDFGWLKSCLRWSVLMF